MLRTHYINDNINKSDLLDALNMIFGVLNTDMYSDDAKPEKHNKEEQVINVTSQQNDQENKIKGNVSLNDRIKNIQQNKGNAVYYKSRELADKLLGFLELYTSGKQLPDNVTIDFDNDVITDKVKFAKLTCSGEYKLEDYRKQKVNDVIREKGGFDTVETQIEPNNVQVFLTLK